MHRLVVVLAAAFALAGLTAPAASALEYCVQLDDVCDPGNEHMSLQDAMDAAGATAVEDTINIGAVTIAEDPGGPMGNGFHYTSTAGAGNDVTLIGRGADETTIQRSDDREFGTFMTSVDSHVTLQDLEIHVIGNTTFDSDASNGLRVDPGGATLTRVRVTAEDGAFNHAFNSGVRLLAASGDLTMTDSTIDGAGNGNAECLRSNVNMTPVITGTEFIDCDFGVRATASSHPSIDRSTFTGGGTGVRVEDVASVAINRSEFLGDASSLLALNFLANGQFRLDNSLIVREGAHTGAVSVTPSTDGDVSSGVVNQSTLINTAAVPASSVGVFVSRDNPARDAIVAIHDSIIFGFFNSSFEFGTLTGEFSFYDFATADRSPGTGDIDSVGDTVDPGFVNPPSDYSLASGSILRDVDPNVAARPGEVFTTDLALNPRIDNGARDVGAYESKFVPVPDPQVDTPKTTPTGKRAAALKKCKKIKKRKARNRCKKKAKKRPL